MDWTIAFYLIPYFASLVISLGVGVEAWQRKNRSAKAYTWVAFSQAFWTLGYIFELIQPTINSKIFWDNLQFIGGVGWSLAFISFTLRYTDRQFSKPKRTYLALAMPGILIVLLAFTNPVHLLVRPQSMLIDAYPFTALTYEITPLFWAWAIYSYGLGLAAVALLLLKYSYTQPLYRTQVGLIVLGNAIPFIGTFLTLSGLIQLSLRDVTPLTFPLGNIFVALGLFQYRLFDVKPIAHDIIIESMKDAVFVFDLERRIVDLNQAARVSINRMDSQLIGEKIDSALAAWPDIVRQYEALIAQDQVEIEVVMGKQPHYIELTVQPLINRRGKRLGHVVLAQDVTKQKTAAFHLQQRTDELETANEQLLHLSKIKDEFVSIVSHELRTPITSLKLHHSLLKHNPQKQASYLSIMERETDRLANLIEDILTVSRFDQNQYTLKRQPVDLNSLVKELIQDRRPLAENQHLTLNFKSLSPLSGVSADSNFLGQAVSIILTNAINYTLSNGCISVTMQRVESEGQDWVGVEIKDNGSGITPEEQKQLFSRFFRGQAGQDSGVPGTGLGLVIANEIIKRHNGRLHIHSSSVPGEGTTVNILLPCAQS